MSVCDCLIKLLTLLDMKKIGYIFAAAAFCLAACSAWAADGVSVEIAFDWEVKAPKKEVKTVVLKSDGMHCEKCAEKVNGNIAFEKGVVDLKTDVKTRTITIKYDASKTSVEKLVAALKKLGYTAEVVKE